MDKESTQLLKIVLVGFAVIILFLLWAGFTEAADNAGGASLQMVALPTALSSLL